MMQMLGWPKEGYERNDDDDFLYEKVSKFNRRN